MWAAAIFALAVLGVLLLVWVGQRTLIYFPDRARAFAGRDRPPRRRSGADSGSGRRDSSGVVSPEPFTTAVTGGDCVQRQRRQQGLPQSRSRRRCGGLGLSVLLFDYRGFGDSDGSPTERGLHEDARAVRRYLAGRSDVRADRLVYFGESLGTAVAVRLAVEHPPAAMILRSPFTSLVDVGRLHYPILPVRWLLRDRFSPSTRSGASGRRC